MNGAYGLQEVFFMPRILVVDDEADIVTLIERYELYGGVVRWAVGENKGQIVKHLKPI